ncbi:hypothetical protein J8J14_15395 [Roseomonas sp. SSH11]|uniref:OmpA-like domain-containing protein n=1 Tax=Pararoseomonas baculiformis TaxID=2820812 RepID=A0ABS4AGJ7_9PROT|nr:hypothetical protein [Pararoseomonas baculiformis]MBP0446158.1 hypothetical protein [Pararoseomonas baculiformis]
MTPALLRPAATAALAIFLLAGFAQVPASGQATDADAAMPEAPAEPGDAPPDAADLSKAPLPALPADVANMTLAPDFTRLPIGGWRLGGRSGRGDPDHGARMAIEMIGRYLAQQTTGRVTLIAQVSGPEDDPSVARRSSLARAISVKASLMRGGLPGTRIDIRPLGRTAEAVDALDIVAPPEPRPRPATAATATPAPGTAPAGRGG